MTRDMQELVLSINQLAESFTDVFADDSEKVQKAHDVVIESARYRHDGWHKKNGASEQDCPGKIFFILEALKGFLASHMDDWTDGDAMALIFFTGANIGAMEHAAETAKEVYDDKIPKTVEEVRKQAEHRRKYLSKMTKEEKREMFLTNDSKSNPFMSDDPVLQERLQQVGIDPNAGPEERLRAIHKLLSKHEVKDPVTEEIRKHILREMEDLL